MKTIHLSQYDNGKFILTVKGDDFRGDSDKLIGADTFEALVRVIRETFKPPLSDDKPPQDLITAVLLDAKLRAAYTKAQHELAAEDSSDKIVNLEFIKGKLFAYRHAIDMCLEIADSHLPLSPKDSV